MLNLFIRLDSSAWLAVKLVLVITMLNMEDEIL